VDDIQVLDDGAVAVVEPSGPADFDIFPNPATSSILIEGLPDAAEFKITNASGTTVLTGATEGDKTGIDISRLPAGLYVFQTVFGAKKWVKI